jgi:uncharacterized protein involved in exopolysaccharide biosynthesis
MNIKDLANKISQVEDMLSDLALNKPPVGKQGSQAYKVGRQFQAELANLIADLAKSAGPSMDYGISTLEYDILHQQQNKILAIKYHRERTGSDLITAKRAIEDAMQKMFGYTSFPAKVG